jgi:hypothetical protein
MRLHWRLAVSVGSELSASLPLGTVFRSWTSICRQTYSQDAFPLSLLADYTNNLIGGNGMSPNASEFSQTIPYFQCQVYGTQCVASCNGDSTCQGACREDNPCGAQDPTRVNVTSTSSAMASTTLPAGASSGTAGVVYTGLGGVATPTTSADDTKHNSASAIEFGRSYGLVAVFTGLFAGFALVM